MTQLDKVTQQNAAMVEEATASSHALNAEAGNLGELVARFNRAKGHGGMASGMTTAQDNVMMFQSPRRQQQDSLPVIKATPAAMTGTYGRSTGTASDE